MDALEKIEINSKHATLDQTILHFVPLATWGGRESNRPFYFHLKPYHVVCMNTASEACYDKTDCTRIIKAMLDFKVLHQDKQDLRYNFIIGGDGRVYEMRGWITQPLLPKNYQHLGRASILIGFLGTYIENTIPSIMKSTCHKLLRYAVGNGFLCRDYKIHNIFAGDGTPVPYRYCWYNDCNDNDIHP